MTILVVYMSCDRMQQTCTVVGTLVFDIYMCLLLKV